jgi:hypothetical protein
MGVRVERWTDGNMDRWIMGPEETCRNSRLSIGFAFVSFEMSNVFSMPFALKNCCKSL